MSIKLVKPEIERFLAGTSEEVLCISGKWGVGKTYGWNYFLKEAKKAGKIGLKRYSYVSLFGVKTLDELRYALYESTKPIERIGEELQWDDLGPKNAQTTFEGPVRWLMGKISRVPFIQNYLGITESILFYLVGKQLICIDDLERAGNGLDVLDVFGLVSFLKEQRGCRIVLLLNEEEIEEGQKAVFDKQFEKVVDTHLRFKPDPIEAADIVFPLVSEGIKKDLHDHVITLGIVNIRVIKKIEKIAVRLEEILKDKYSQLIYQAVHSAALFAWARYQKDTDPPPLDFLKDIGRLHGLAKDKEKSTEHDGRWAALMAEYKFSSVDDFDLEIHQIVESGLFDNESLLKAAAKHDQGVTKAKQEQVIHDTWDLYRDSFDDNEKEVLDKIFKVSMENVKVIAPSNLDGTIRTLKEFGRGEQATLLIKKYIEERGSEKELFDGRQSFFDREPKEEEFGQAFEKARSKFTDDRNPADVLENMITGHGWNPADTDLVNKLTTDDFYKIFKAEKGDRLHRIIRAARQLNDHILDGKTVPERAAEALVKIGGESRLNAKRVEGQGIKLPEKQ